MKRLRIKTVNWLLEIDEVPAWLAFAALVALVILLLSGVWTWG